MSIKRIYAIFLRQIYLLKSNTIRLTSSFLWIIIDVIQWGFISKYLGTMGQSTFNFITVILGAIILWEFLSRIQQGIMTSFLEDIWSNNFINFFGSPLKIGEYLSGLVVTSIATSVIGLVAMIIIAGLGFGYNFFMLGLNILPYLIILFVFGMAMGIFVTAVIFRFGPAAEWISWPIPLVMSIFSGVFYPIATLPVYMQVIAKLLPASYIFESMRGLISGNLGTAQLSANLFYGFILALAYLFASYFFFISVYRRNLKNGSIPRFNVY